MIILLRHGRTPANAQGLLQGRLDPALDALGRRQAAAAAEAIGPVDRLIASPLVRAQQTAAAFGPDVAIETDERFIELNYGDWEGKRTSDLSPDTWANWRADLDFRPPNGESLSDVGRRVRDALGELAPAAADARIVVVSHVSPIKAAVAWGLGVDDATTWRTYLGQASICRIATGGGTPRLVEFNVTAHLEGLENPS